MTTETTRAFDEWLTNSEHRFRAGYIDARLVREQRKRSGLLKRESQPFKKMLTPRSMVKTVLRFTGMAYLGRRNANKVRLTQHKLVMPKLPNAFNGFKVLHISDLHFNGSQEFADNLVTIITGAEYDICVLTGDYRFRSFGSMENTMLGLRMLTDVIHTDAFAILGNHDSLLMVPTMEQMGIDVLLNENRVIQKNGESLLLVGVDDPSYYKLHALSLALESPGNQSQNMCSLLLAHSPQIVEQAHAHGIDAYLCGHTHGGQICLPGGYPIFKPARCPAWNFSGGWQYQEVAGYTSRGAGTSMVEARFFCPPEITVHTLVASD